MAAPAAIHGPPTRIGSIHAWFLSTRLVPVRDAKPWWVNSLRMPVWVIGLSGRIVRKDARWASTALMRSGSEQEQPVGCTTFAVPISNLADDPRQPGRGCRGTENRREESMFDGSLPRPFLRLPLREVPMCAGRFGVEPLLWDRRPVLRVEVHAPPGDPRPQLVAGGDRGPLGGVGGHLIGRFLRGW